MKKRIGIMLVLLLFCFCGGCGYGAVSSRAPVGKIGADSAISREMAAKTIALAFDTPENLMQQEAAPDFSDVTREDWAYLYIAGCVAQGFFAGSEEGTFRPKDDLTLWEAQALMDRLSPEYESRIVLTEENKNMAVSYELWVQLLQTALQARGGGLAAYGLRVENAVLLTAAGLCDTGKFSAAGLDLEKYLYSRITFLEKDGEIAALLTVEAASPMIRDIYCREMDGMLALETGEGAALLPFNGEFTEGIADVKLEDGRVAEVQAAASLGQCEVKRVDAEEIYLTEQGAMPWDENARIYDGKDENWTREDCGALICGTSIAEFYEKDGKICGAVLREAARLENIRVFLRGEPQEKVMIRAEGGFSLSNAKHTKAFAAGESAILTADLPWFAAGIVEVTADAPIELEFADGISRRYAGSLEMERRGNGIAIVNELPPEEYLLGVVPYEMPTNFGQTALEAQAITARSYAYRQFYANSYCAYGAHLTDTVASQVYQGGTADEIVRAAVENTAGQCVITADGKVAQTYFYAASGGFGASNAEVWSKDGKFGGSAKEYLTAQAYGDFAAPETEADWLAFWQDWDCEGYDMDAPWYRWKVYFSCGQLSEIAEETMQKAAERNPALVLLRQADGSFLAGVPKNPGRLQGISVTKRGAGGVVMELELAFERETVRLRTEYTVREVLSPTKRTMGEPIYLQRKDGTSLTGNAMLPSGYFAVREMRNAEGALTGIALYGGGNGHGVGMSQYGAKRLAEQGKSAAEILQLYFPGTRIERVL